MCPFYIYYYYYYYFVIIFWLKLIFHQLHGQHQMQFSQPLGHQQFQGRQLPSGHVQHGMGQNPLNQGNPLNRHLSQFSGTANNALFNAAQGSPNTQMVRYVNSLP